MTQPHVDDGTLRRVGVVPTPWPSFAVCAAEAMLADKAELVGSVIDAAAAGAGEFHGQDDAAHLVASRFGLAEDDAAAWLEQVRWTEPAAVVVFRAHRIDHRTYGATRPNRRNGHILSK